MPIKFDKDMLLKHRFWVLLAVTVPLILTAIGILITSVSASIDKERKEVVEMAKKIAKPGPAVGQKVKDKQKQVADERKSKESVVHRNAFDEQEEIATFPVNFENKYDFRKGWFATEVKILGEPKADENEWPADGEDLIHGVVKSVNEIFAVLVGREKKEYTIRRTAKEVLKVSRQEAKEGEKVLDWSSIQPGEFVAVTYYKSKYFFDPFTADERIDFAREYKSQIHSILQLVEPVGPDGHGVVQLGSWPYEPNSYPPEKSKFFTYVAGEWKTDIASFEEAWLAQEDLWIQRELFRMIREANDSVGRCKVGDDPATGKPIYVNPHAEDRTKPAVFYNPYYLVTVAWVGDAKLAVTIKNQLDRRQKADVAFRIRLSKSDNRQLATQVVRLESEPLNPRGDPKDSVTKEFPLEKSGIPRTGIYEVEQVLTWETAAVKRIDQIAIGAAAGDVAHSHRTFPEGSKPYREEKKEEKKDDASGPPGVTPGQTSLGPGVGGSAGGPRGSGGIIPGGNTGGTAVELNYGPNGVLKDRYLEVSDQSRRVPVAIAMIVDQDHINRVLTAFNNSKLRFLMTQVLVNRYSGSLQPAALAVASSSGSSGGSEGSSLPSFGPMGAVGPKGGGSSLGPPPGAVTGGGPRPEGSGGGPPKGINFPGTSAPATGFNPGQTGSSAASTAPTEEIENNVELVIYGIMTLYERYPKRKNTGETK
ncbi:MAG: hypothetical protein NZO58_02505 [Gemmataceae bacterium]|nr:hypothetical protein [Gemmataceae bacterium]